VFCGRDVITWPQAVRRVAGSRSLVCVMVGAGEDVVGVDSGERHCR
jgi:hypothetical protein